MTPRSGCAPTIGFYSRSQRLVGGSACFLTGSDIGQRLLAPQVVTATRLTNLSDRVVTSAPCDVKMIRFRARRGGAATG